MSKLMENGQNLDFQIFRVNQNFDPIVTPLLIKYLDHRWARVLGQGGCVHRGVSKEKICGRLRRPKYFFHQGVKFFFLRGVLLVDRVVILQKNDKK